MRQQEGKIEREELGEKDRGLVKHTSQLLRQAAESLKPRGSEHVGSVAFHLYARTNLITAENEISIVTQNADITISADAVGFIMPEIRDRVIEAFGGQRMKLKPTSVEQTKDEGGAVIDNDN